MEKEYKVGEREVFIVLHAHGMADEVDDMVVMDTLDRVQRFSNRIEDAAGYGEDEEEQVEFALSEIEAVLIEGGQIKGEKRFEMLDGVGA